MVPLRWSLLTPRVAQSPEGKPLRVGKALIYSAFPISRVERGESTQ